MVTTRSAASTLPTTIVAARALRHQRRARTADEEILGQTQVVKPNRRQRRSTSAKTNEPPPAKEEQDQIQTDLPQDNHTLIQTNPVAGPQDSVSSHNSQTTLRPTNLDLQPPQPTHPCPRPQSPLNRRWFAPIGKVALPNPTAPISQPAESLFHFASGVPTIKPQNKPSQTEGKQPELNPSSGVAGLPQTDSAYIAQRQDAITKAATAVMAHMNGHDVSRADYVSILDGMLVDPEMRTRLPPVLVEQYDAAVQGQETTLYNGGLIEKFINATKLATDFTARVLMSNKNARRDRRAHRARHRPSPSYQVPLPTADPTEPHNQSPPVMAGPSHDMREDSRYDTDFFHDPTTSFRPLIFSQPLTEANLHRRTLIQQGKGKARDTTGIREDERSGVMRTTKGLFRPAPYPRRVSADARGNQNLAAEMAAVYPHAYDVPEESSYSVYSASTGMVHQPSAEGQRKNPEESGGKKAERILADIERSQGAEEAARVRSSFFDLFRCYELVATKNADLISKALLEHIADTSRPPTSRRVNPPQVSGSTLPNFHEIPRPPDQMCYYPDIGPGKISFCRVFEPVDPSSSGLPHRRIIFDSPMRPPPAP